MSGLDFDDCLRIDAGGECLPLSLLRIATEAALAISCERFETPETEKNGDTFSDGVALLETARIGQSDENVTVR
jgi:hypothetical protein